VTSVFFLVFDLEASGLLDPLEFVLAAKSLICGHSRMIGSPLPSISSIRSIAITVCRMKLTLEIFNYIDTDRSKEIDFIE